ncbi:ABC transporter permease [Thalassobacillus hwangdonensis]|uniref:ABC transporter permease n=1 Tax=Thalassobacillus hwangdonensis TaxID=546108 RepID=A0ABW3L1B0_9BACI
MSINYLILQNLKKNLQNYFLYIFALMFSVALYFSFVTLQYDPSMDGTKGTIKGGAAVGTASILLVAIVAIFLLYANTIFIKRRSKEIGLFQLIGLKKGEIFRILSVENLILYFSSMAAGIFLGFASSKLILMILFNITKVDTAATLRFSEKALVQTLLVFGGIYLLIMAMNYLFIKRQTILSLFRVTSSTESAKRRRPVLEVVFGIIGISMIALGYYLSSKLFGGDFTTMNQLFMVMVIILASTIIGTYFFYKGSVSYLSNLIRKNKGGYMNIQDVMSLSSIMFRMKSNSLLLTVITTVSALAIALLSLSYISYYSAEKLASDSVAADFSFTEEADAEKFTSGLKELEIGYEQEKIDVVQVAVDISRILDGKIDGLTANLEETYMPVISDADVEVDVSKEEPIFTGYNDLLQKFMQFRDSGPVVFHGKTEELELQYSGLEKDHPISGYFTSGGVPVAIVDDSIFERLQADADPELQYESSLHIGVHLDDQDKMEKANKLFTSLDFGETGASQSWLETSDQQKMMMGLVMFIVGFLGLTFLVTSGCILYFKQMNESESERPSYTILRKLGFTRKDLVKGIRVKQLFNFGIPLVVGLLHSYFAVKSGWFMFGAELWTPMLIVMVLYAGLYSIFGFLSVLYYKKVIREAL